MIRLPTTRRGLIATAGVALTAAACTYDPPRHSSDWYANPTQYEDDSAVHPERERFQAYVEEAVADGLPGAVLLVRSPEAGTWVGSAGMADIASEVSWQPAMIGRIGSATKMFVAAVVLQLVDEEKLDLDDPARKYLPRGVVTNIENAGEATVRQLLNHTSGIFDYVSSVRFLSDAYGRYDFEYHSTEELLRYAYGEKADFAPGTSWAYSNTGFLLLELIVEHVTGQDGIDVMAERVIEPLDLQSTTYRPDLPAPQGLARGYADLFGDARLNDVTDLDMERFHFDGGVISNVYDLADFLDALLDGEILSPEARDELLNTVPTEGHSQRGTDHYGLGIIMEESKEYGRVYGHLGNALGFTTHVYRVLDSGITFVALVNASQHVSEQRSYDWFGPLQTDRILRLVSHAR